MTTEEIEAVAQALTAVAENLEAGTARQSMREAFTEVHAYRKDEQTGMTEQLGADRRMADRRRLPLPSDRLGQL